MIEFKNIKENAQYAFEQEEFFEFLTGRKGYDLIVIDVPIDVPTDWSRIIPLGIYAIYEESKNPKIIAEYEAAIIKMIENSIEDLWIAVNILYFQFDHEMSNTAPFLIDKKTISNLREKIIANRQELEKKYPYGKNGWNMYEDILRLNSNFIEDWNKSFLN